MPKKVVRVAAMVAIVVSFVSILPVSATGGDTQNPPNPDTPFHMFFPATSHNRAPSAVIGYGISPATVNPTAAIPHVQTLGLGWVKFLLPWKDIEPQQGQFSWGYADSLINPYAAAGIRVLLTISKAPNWARPAGDDRTVEGMPADPATYAAFVARVATRYRGKVQAIEVWSEPNIYYTVGGVGRVNPATYAALLRATYPAIKGVAPEVLVITAGLVPTAAPLPIGLDDIEYLDQLYNHNIRGYFDAVGAHPAGYNCPALADWRTVTDPTAVFRGPFTNRHHSWCFLGTMEGYRNVMVAHGDGSMKIAVTEFGWASTSNPASGLQFAGDNTYAEQAEWIVQAYQWGKNSGWVNMMILWNLDYGVYSPTSPISYWSLLRQTGPIPAYAAVAAMPK